MVKRKRKINKPFKNQRRLFLLISCVIVFLLVVVGLFYYKKVFTNSVLGIETTRPFYASLTCATCNAFYHQPTAIVLQKNGNNPANWGASCIPLASLNNNKYSGYILCSVPTPTPTITQPTGRIVVNIVNANNQFINPPAGNIIKIYSGNSPTLVKLLGMIDSNSQGWSGQVVAGTDSIVAYPTSNYAVNFSWCYGCQTPPGTSYAGASFLGGVAYFPTVFASKELDVFVRFRAK